MDGEERTVVSYERKGLEAINTSGQGGLLYRVNPNGFSW